MAQRHRARGRKLLAVDLFSGCGGLTTGLKRAGFEVVGAVEREALEAETYKVNHPTTRLWQGDIRWVAASWVARTLKLTPGRLDLLAGCPPCQAYSTVRTLNGHRSVRESTKDLLFQVLRFVKRLQPKTVMLENVPGLKDDARWGVFVSRLTKLGYSCRFDVLNAAAYGVPQRRRRLILLASRVGEPAFAPPARRRRTVIEALQGVGRRGSSGDELHDFPENRNHRVLRLIKRIPKNGGSRTDLQKRFQLDCHKEFDGFKDIYGRMKWNDIAPTITGGCVNPSKGRFVHPRRDGAITLREAALLQTFPRRYFFSLSKGKHAVAAMIGNALPPEFVRRHARALAKLVRNARREPPTERGNAAARRR